MQTKTGPEGTITYAYDTKPNGKGMLASVTGFNGINSDYIYDSQSRLASKTETGIDPTVPQGFSFSYQYDNLNRLTQTTYPGGFITKRNYNGIGYFQSVTDANSNLIWQCDAMNQRLQVTGATQGNGGTLNKTYNKLGFLTKIYRYENSQTAMYELYDFDITTGNLKERRNFLNAALIEQFTYDKLDRLTNVAYNFNPPAQNISYLPSGNISSKTDAGPTYNYATLPHAVSSIDNPTANLPTIQQDITYTAFQKAENISENNLNLHFTYGPDYPPLLWICFLKEK